MNEWIKFVVDHGTYWWWMFPYCVCIWYCITEWLYNFSWCSGIAWIDLILQFCLPCRRRHSCCCCCFYRVHVTLTMMPSSFGSFVLHWNIHDHPWCYWLEWIPLFIRGFFWNGTIRLIVFFALSSAASSSSSLLLPLLRFIVVVILHLFLAFFCIRSWGLLPLVC